MPLLDVENDVTMATETEDFRGRSGSNSSTGSGVFRGFFRKKHKSGGGEPSSNSQHSSRGSSPGNTPSGSKVKNFFENFRPRSGSNKDVEQKGQGHNPVVNQPQRRRSGSGNPPPQTVYENESERSRHRSCSTSTPPTTPMSRLLADGSQTTGKVPMKNQELIDDFRQRAYSDPRPRSRAVVLAARRAAMAKRVRLLVLHIVSFYSGTFVLEASV